MTLEILRKKQTVDLFLFPKEIFKRKFHFCEEKYPVITYLFKFSNDYARKKCKRYSKLTIKTPERR